MSSNNATKRLEWDEHIRLRPVMYVGKCGDGSDAEDGLYVLLKEIINNSVDEYHAGFGKEIIVNIDNKRLTVRDFGRGIDFDRLVHFHQEFVNAKDKIHIAHRAIGLTGVGFITVVALSSEATIISYQNGLLKRITTSQGKIVSIDDTQSTSEPDGLSVSFIPDNQIFENYTIRVDYLRDLLKQYAVCEPGLKLKFGNEVFYAPFGMLNLIEDLSSGSDTQNGIHIVDELCDIAIAPASNAGDIIVKSFVNGHPTIMAGPHVSFLIDAVYECIKKLVPHRLLKCDLLANLIMCINIKIENPQFESCTRTKLASRDMYEGGKSIKQYITELIETNLSEILKSKPVIKNVLIDALTRTPIF